MIDEVAGITFHDAQDAVAPVAPVTVGGAVANTPAPATLNTAPAPLAQPTIEAVDLERLIEGAESKLRELRAANFAADNNRQEQRQIDAAIAAIAQLDATITRFETLSTQALESVESAVEQQINGIPVLGQWGVPQIANLHSQAAGTYAQLRLSLAQHRRSRALQAERLETLRRVQAQHSPKSAT
jgi:hypothetical protein